MKRLTTILFVALLAGPVAGPAVAADWTLGFKGGVALAELGGDDLISDVTGTRTGFVGGAFAQADVSKHFGVRLEGLYHMKGAEVEEFGVTVGVNLDYVEFPVLLVGRVPASESATFSAFAGPVLGFNTSAKAKASFGFISASESIDEYIAPFEFGLAFGLGTSFGVGSVIVSLDGRYQMGLTNIDDGLAEAVDDLVGIAVDPDITNQGWAFMAGIGFPIGGN